MGFAAKVVDVERGPLWDTDLLGRKAPCANGFVSSQFSDETGKGDLPIRGVTGARTGSDGSVKATRIAIVSNVDGGLG